MLDPRWRKVLRDLWLHKARSLLVVLAVAVGIAGAGIVLDAWALVNVATRDGYLASNPAAATLRTDRVDASLLARVRAVPGVADAQGRRTLIGRVRALGTWQTTVVFVHERFDAIRIGTVKPEVGQWPPADGAFVIERSSLDFSGVAVGETIDLDLARSGNQSPVSVTGVARDVGLAPGWMEHVVYGFMTLATAARLGAPSTLDEIQITVRDRSLGRDAVRRIAYAVKAAVEAAGRTVTSVDVPVPGQHIHAAQMDSLLLTQGAFGALALLLSGFLVVNLFVAMLAGQVREIGVMKSLGARSSQIAVMYLAMALVLGLIASGVAIPVARALGTRYATLKADLLNFDLGGVTLPLWVIALQVAAGVVVPVVAAAIPVARGCRISVGAALRDAGIAPVSGAGGALLQRASGLSRPILLSLRNAFRRRQRMVLTLTTLAAGGAVFLGARNLETAIRDAVDLLFAAQRYDLSVSFDAPHAADSLEAALRGIPGVAAAEVWGGVRGALARSDRTLGNAFPIVALPMPTTMLGFAISEGRWLEPRDANALVMSSSLAAQDSSFRIGATVPLMVGGRLASWSIVGIVKAGPSPSAFAPREAVARVIGDASVDRAVVRLAPHDEETGPSTFGTIQLLRGSLAAAGFAVANSQLVDENRRVIEDHLLMVAQFLGAMAWLMIVVGGLALASTMSLSVLERTREIGVFRAIGARHGAIVAMVQVEGLVIAMLGWLVAMPLSLPVSITLGRVFGRIMLPVPDRWVPEAAGVGWWLVLVLVVSVVACAWPALRAMRVPARVALSYE